jgi:hypothetical protein
MTDLRRVLVLLVAVSFLTGMSCLRPVRSSLLIDASRRADCVAPTFAKGVEPPTRGWDTTIAVAGGSQATVRGAEMVWGKITIRFEPDGPSVTAVQPGDYIYPGDVRVNEARDRLYVKASGAAAGIWHETWLYEYDLQNRKQVRKQRVHPEVLPTECPMPERR